MQFRGPFVGRKALGRERPDALVKAVDFAATRKTAELADALVAETIRSETVNLAYGQGNALVDVVNMIGMCLGKTPNVAYEHSRSGEVTRYVADIRSARDLLGYEPIMHLREGLVRTIAS